jgi:uncharacterized membrane protein
MTDYLPFVSAESGRSVQRGTRWQRVALWFVFCWFFFGGIAHFALTDLEARIVPPQIPDARDMVLFTGILELAGAFGLLLPWTRRAAGWGLFLLTLAVTPANIYMLQHAELFNVPRWALMVRLPFQLVLLALILWCTKAMARAPNPASTANLQ